MIGEAFLRAGQMLIEADRELLEIVARSLQVSSLATVFGALIGLPLGAWAAVSRNGFRAMVIVLLNAAMALPPVVVGLTVYLLLSRSGPLGALGWLFTPAGMVLAQTLLIAPIIAALTRQTVEDAHAVYRDWFCSLGLSTGRQVRTLLFEVRRSLVVVLLAGFGRAIAEVGAVMMVGGNIAGETRVMTTAIALETAKGELPLALGLGVILLGVVLDINIAAHLIRGWVEARHYA
ncbi:MAG: ABC transporter permease [Casimicrobiaceae bacterium]